MPHQHLEHRELAGGEVEALAILREGAGAEIEDERAEGDGADVVHGPARAVVGDLAPKHRMHPGHQFPGVEGLLHVVVRPHLETDDTVDIVTLGGEHDDGGPVVGGAQPADDRESVLAGKHLVEDDQVKAFALHQPVQRGRVGSKGDLELLLRQITVEQIPQFGVVINDNKFPDAGVHFSMISGFLYPLTSLEASGCEDPCLFGNLLPIVTRSVKTLILSILKHRQIPLNP